MAKVCKIVLPVDELELLISTLKWVLIATQPTKEDRKKLSDTLYRLIAAKKIQTDVQNVSGPLN